MQPVAGELVLDYAWPEPTPLAGDHDRLAAGPRDPSAASPTAQPATSADLRPSPRPGCYAATADEALAQLDTAYDAWSAGVECLGEEGLARPCGAAEGHFAAAPMADLVLHINRELIHHGAEICLLRDLYQRQPRRGASMSRDLQVTFDCRRPDRPSRLLGRGAGLRHPTAPRR